MINKRIIATLVLFILVLPISLAEIEISLDSYDSTTKLAKIKISNVGSVIYSEVKMVVDQTMQSHIVDLLSIGSSIIVPQILEPGDHTVKVITNEGGPFDELIKLSRAYSEVLAQTEREERLIQLRREELQERARETEEKLKKKAIAQLNGEIEPTEDQSSLDEPSPDKELAIIVLAAVSLLLIIFERKRIFKIFSKNKK